MRRIRKLLALSLALVLSMNLTACAQATDPQTVTAQTTANQVSAPAFTDVPEWCAEAVRWAVAEGITVGTTSTTFSPEQTGSHGEILTFLWRAAGSPEPTGSNPFSNVSSTSFYYKAALWAYEAGLVTTSFAPSAPCTRSDTAVYLWKAAGSPEPASASNFADVPSNADYQKAVAWAAENGVAAGTGNNCFSPDATCNRGQIVTFLYRARNLLTTPEPGTGKTLVAYFSRTGENYNVGVIEKGNTAILAEMIASQTGSDLFEIAPVTPYPSDYAEMLEVARQEAADDARPEINGTVENWTSYNVVFLGYPIWNGDMPKIVYHFLESYDFTGKTIVPFCTHEGSGLSRTVESIRSACPGATVLDGLAVRGQTAQNSRDEAKTSVENWLDGLDLPKSEEPAASAAGAFDLENRTVLLNNGIEMPILGIGCFRLSDEQAENSVYWALRDGYRLIDTARIYGNEEGVGRGIRRAIDEGLVTREEVFVTTKMWTSDFDNGDAAVDASLRRLGLDYIDLMILHHSQPSNDVDAYKAMERAVESGKLRSIGLSNFYTGEDFDRLVNATTIVPALLQNETHPYHQSEDMKEHLAQYGTVMESWFPLGGRGNTQTLFNDPTISAIAAAHGKTSAQVILRWHLQAGNIAIPGSSNEDHIQENFEIFDFELTADEMAQMTALDKNQRFAGY